MEERIWEFAENNDNRVHELIEEASVTRPIALVLAARDISPETVHDFLYPDLDNIGDPFLLPGTQIASERLWQAIRRNEQIIIHGDYDTDGITASPLSRIRSTRPSIIAPAEV